MIYSPLHIESPGIINESWGIGVLTPMGAFITSQIPPFARIFAKAFIPKSTIFRAKNGTTIPYVLPPNMALGEKLLTAYMNKPKPHYETISMKLTQVVPIDVNIIIEEVEIGSFKIMPYNIKSETINQPKNGWSLLF